MQLSELPKPLQKIVLKGINGCNATRYTKKVGQIWLDWLRDNNLCDCEITVNNEVYKIDMCVLCTMYESI